MRTRRRFTAEFKETVVAWLKTSPVSDVARMCNVSVSVLHRWRSALMEHPVNPSAGRRRFARQLKAEAIERIERGATVTEVAAAFALRANTLHRWRKEAREFGEEAFSGYGKSRAAPPPARMIKITLQSDEHDRIKEAFENSPARSLPDFARARVLDEVNGGEDAAIAEIDAKLGDLTAILQRMAYSGHV